MKISGYYYTVEAMDGATNEAMGDHNAEHLRIRIATNIAPQQIQSTVLHEILEALNFHLHLGLGTDNAIVCPLEAGLYTALTENGIDLSPLAKLVRKKT